MDCPDIGLGFILEALVNGHTMSVEGDCEGWIVVLSSSKKPDINQVIIHWTEGRGSDIEITFGGGVIVIPLDTPSNTYHKEKIRQLFLDMSCLNHTFGVLQATDADVTGFRYLFNLLKEKGK